MADVFTTADAARKGDAADWLARLSGPESDVETATAFDAWVSDPANGRAYDRALSVMLEIEAAAPRIVEALDEAAPRRRANLSRTWMAVGGLAAAAAIAVAVTPLSVIIPETLTYATAKGEHRTIKLADGSTVELNGGSRLIVTLRRNVRSLSLPEGEALFDVAPDKSRPFLIAAGDRMVRVVGTRFDVRHIGSDLSVTVERGLVEVRPSDGARGQVYRLHPGQRLDTHLAATAAAPAAQLSETDPLAVESWRTGRLIYRDRPLAFMSNRLLRILPHFILSVTTAILLCALFDRLGTLRLSRDEAAGARVVGAETPGGVIFAVPESGVYEMG